MSVPVIALTGHLGAGKTTVLNHLLSAPGARVGVVINDFGAVNIDAGLVVGQIDEAASIAGGCICCLPDDGGLDQALAKLTDPQLRLDAVVIEASGVAEPLALARLVRFSGAENARLGGVIDIVDAIEHEHTVDTGGVPLARYAAATLVVINKLDAVADPEERRARITERIRERNPHVPVIASVRGRIDPALVFDVAQKEDPVDELPIAALLREEHRGHGDHVHADAVSVPVSGSVDAGALVDLLEDPPGGVYRLKGTVPVCSRRYLVNLVGRSIHVRTARSGQGENALVAIGVDLDIEEVRRRLQGVVSGPTAGAAGVRRLQRYRRLSA
ncbi:CobW family GTP-binding protein [Microbacterium amylolyticum]|uniref:G3E family GTPase n=1 Tax=Microbacterium amylolyticum TaxID=936337 RepID=A0ABS4ZFP4_9MICO|nr:GTP-binding protein [Microbacterium amylolyticum]MBP2436037.1 G3E family GTPase [Microbacterium amylolyticum]